ncbi:unnamed protein product [Strongylus vulgaris]|uniref:Amino acid transporter transmembrane domain-containing protein n=1 Tax=Strongylus vulgaris TaxID=40348 RepID=A0A3P7IG15_STRVU|nr:unnamed protein product [Strongylus vulgaris]
MPSKSVAIQSLNLNHISIAQTTSGKHENSHGLHWAMASVFVVGDMVGGGMIVLPNAVVNAAALTYDVDNFAGAFCNG